MKKLNEILDKIPSVYKTFAWNCLYQGIAAALTWAVANLSQLPIPVEVSVILGLILSGMSKYIAQQSKK